MKTNIFLFTLFFTSSLTAIAQTPTEEQNYQSCLEQKRAFLQMDVDNSLPTNNPHYVGVGYINSYHPIVFTTGITQQTELVLLTSEGLGIRRAMYCFKSASEEDYANSLKNVEKPYCGNPTLGHGSIIDYNKKTVSESIPIAGTDLYLNYSSEYNPYSNYSKNNAVTYRTPARIGKFYLDVEGIWGTRTSIEQTNIGSMLSFNVSFEPSYSGFSGSHTLTYSLFKENIEIQGFSCDRLENDVYIGCGYAIGRVFDLVSRTIKIISRYNPIGFGLKGWTISEMHYFNSDTRTLFTGYGEKFEYNSFKTINMPEYGQVNLVIEKSTGQLVYIFDQEGKHLETRQAILNYPIYKFSYDANNKITAVTDRFNKQTQFVYDGNGNISQIIAPYGQATTLVTDQNSIIEAKNPLNKSYVMVYDQDRQLTNFTHIDGTETVFAYNQNGEFLSETKNTGVVQTFFDQLSILVKEHYHQLGYGTLKKVSTLFSNDSRVTSEYDSDGNLIAKNTQTYATNNQIYEQANSSNELQFSSPSIWGNEYRSLSYVKTQINESNQNTSQISDISESFSYSDNSNPLSLNNYTIQTNTVGRRTNFTRYNPNTRVLFETDDYSFSNTYLNAQGQPTRIESSLHNPVDLTYNTNGQLIKTQKGTQFESYSYHSTGELASVTNSKNQTTSYVYDSNSRLIEKTLPNSEKIKFEYTDGGEIKKITAPNNQVHNFSLSIGDYLANMLTPNNRQTSFDYDQDKRLTQITKPSGKQINYNYKTQSSYLENITTSDGVITVNEIDTNARLKSITSHDQIKTQLSWAGNQLQKQTWYDSDNSEIGSISFNFKSNELKIDNIKLNNQTIATYSYNSTHGKVATINNSTYTYSVQNFVDTTTINSGNLNINYRNHDDLSGDQPTRYISATAREDITAQIFITLQRSFDSFGQASNYSTLTVNNSLGVLNSYYQLTPQYDENDRLVQIQKNRRNYLNGQEVSTTDFYNHYSYPLGSNNNMKEFTQTSTANGNPQKRTIATHDNEDRLLTLRGSIHRDYTYTDDGDLKTMTNCYGTTTYDYDVFGNLKKVTLADGKVIEYKVDAQNRRVKKLVNGTVKEYYLWYDQIHLAAILDENKVPKLTYIYGPESNSPSYVIHDNVTYRILHDPGLGSIRYIVNPATQQIVQDIEYDEYGNVMKNTNPNFQPLTYAGGLYDQDTGFYRFGARDYDPKIGRWTTKDPIGFAGGDTNLYAYVGGNPMSYNDPTGHCPLCVVGIGAVVGGTANLIGSGIAGTLNRNNFAQTFGLGAISGAAAVWTAGAVAASVGVTTLSGLLALEIGAGQTLIGAGVATGLDFGLNIAFNSPPSGVNAVELQKALQKKQNPCPLK